MMKNIGPLQFGANFCLEQSSQLFLFIASPKKTFYTRSSLSSPSLISWIYYIFVCTRALWKTTCHCNIKGFCPQRTNFLSFGGNMAPTENTQLSIITLIPLYVLSSFGFLIRNLKCMDQGIKNCFSEMTGYF